MILQPLVRLLDDGLPKKSFPTFRGPKDQGHLPIILALVEGETPTIDIEPENPFFSEKRTRMTFPQLLSEMEEDDGTLQEFVEGLSGEQLDRKAHIPKFKSIMGIPNTGRRDEIGGLGESHVQFPILTTCVRSCKAWAYR